MDLGEGMGLGRRSPAPHVRHPRQPRHPLRPRRGVCAAAVSFALASTLAGCASGGRFEHGVYRDHRIAYRVGPLPPEWARARARRGDVAFTHTGGGTIYTESECGAAAEDVPLPVLTNHLFFDVVIVDELSREALTLDGRAALRTRIIGELDGVPVALDAVVLKKDGCVYDLVLVAGADRLDARARDFEAFFTGFAALGGPP